MRGRRGGGRAMPPVSGTFWPARRPGIPRPRHAPARCRPCPQACGWPCAGSGVARNGHEITTQTQTIVAYDWGACWGALESLPGLAGVLGQMRGCTPVTFV